MDLIKTINNIPDIFGLKMVEALPSPLGFKILNEADIMYLSADLDKWSRYNDRLKILNDLNVSIIQAKHEQTGKTNKSQSCKRNRTGRRKYLVR